MGSDTDDGHGPSYGCGYQACGNPDAEAPCPFVKAGEPTLQQMAQEFQATQCKHEWRQRWVSGSAGERVWPDGYYCVHCLQIGKAS